jgi:hypothetical protein
MGQWRAPSALCHRIDPSGERHHHPESLDTAGRFDKPRRDKQPRIFEKPEAPCHLGLAFVGHADLGILPLAGVESGSEHKTGMARLLGLNGRFSGPDVGLDVPVDGLDRQAWCRAALARVACMGAEVAGVDRVIRPALGPCRQRLVRRVRRREALGLEVQERLVERRTCTLPGGVERGRGARIGRLGLHHQPTLGHAVVAQRKTLIAGVGIKTMPTVQRAGWRDHRCDRANGVGNACDQAEVATPVPAPGTSRWRRYGRPNAYAQRGYRRLQKPSVPKLPASGPGGDLWNIRG